MKRIVGIFLSFILIWCLFGCEKEQTQSIVGEWRTYDIGVNIDSPEVPEYLTFVFNSDGTGSGPVSSFDRLDWPTFTYEVYDDVIKLHTDEDKDMEMKYTIDGDSMTLEYSGYKRTLHRVS